MSAQPAKHKSTSFEEVIEELQPHEKVIKFTAVAFAFVFVLFSIVYSSNISAALDSDNDGFSNSLETYLGTDPTKACGAGAWPVDFNNDKKVDTADTDSMRPYFGTQSGDGKFNKRYDLNADSKIDIVDYGELKPYFGKTCTIPIVKPPASSPTPTPVTTPSKTINLTATTATCPSTYISLFWNFPATGISTFQVLKFDSTTNSFRQIAATNVVAYTDFDVVRGNTYTYKVTQSSQIQSNQVSVALPLCSSTKLGDVDLNGVVDCKDVALILQIDAGNVKLTDLSPQAQKNADVNGDGLVKPSDASKLLQSIPGGCPPPTADIKVNGLDGPITIAYNTQATISWTSQNATACTVSPPGWTGTSGSQSTGNLISPQTYILNCLNNFGSASDSVTVNVLVPPPLAPTGLSGSCSSSNALTFSWSASAGATTYAIRVDDLANGWTGYSPSSGDSLSDNNPTTSYLRSGEAGHTYKWWVHAINSAGWSAEAYGPNVPCAPSPPIGDPGKDAIRDYIKNYVGGWNVRRTIRGYNLNYGRFLWGMAGCESTWNPLAYAGPSYYEKGLYQYQAKNIPGFPDSPYNIWGSTKVSAGLSNADIWNYQHQVQVTSWKVSPGQGDYPQAWSCWNNWFTGARNWTWFTDEWPDPNF